MGGCHEDIVTVLYFTSWFYSWSSVYCFWKTLSSQSIKTTYLLRLQYLFYDHNFSMIFTARRRSLGQGNIFTGHRHLSVHMGGGWSLHDITSCLGGVGGVSVKGDPPHGKELAVRILLECILVSYVASFSIIVQYSFSRQNCCLNRT